MKKTVKTLVLITTCSLLFSAVLTAQLKLPLTSAVAADVKKVMADYPNRFANLMGDMIAEHPQSTDYRCNFNVNGAEETVITRYSANKEVCSWEALMLTTESFEKAKQQFKSLFSQLNNLSVNIGGAGHIRFKGKYEAPGEEKKFTSVVFTAETATGQVIKLKMEISLQFHSPMEWKVKVFLYDRERGDEERGAVRE